MSSLRADEHWGGAGALLVFRGDFNEEEELYSKTAAVTLWLFGVETPNTAVIVRKDNKVTLVSANKKVRTDTKASVLCWFVFLMTLLWSSFLSFSLNFHKKMLNLDRNVAGESRGNDAKGGRRQVCLRDGRSVGRGGCRGPRGYEERRHSAKRCHGTVWRGGPVSC